MCLYQVIDPLIEVGNILVSGCPCVQVCVQKSKLCFGSLNVIIANIKQGVGPQVLSTLIKALPLLEFHIWIPYLF